MKEVVSFESIGNYSYCLRFGASTCRVYAATSDPIELEGGKIQERYHLVDEDGTPVESFNEAFVILTIETVHRFEDELIIELMFHPMWTMNYTEFEAIHELIETSIQPAMVDIGNGQDVGNSVPL